jgi:VanZ family protein
MIKLVKKNILSLITALIILYLSLAPSDTFNKISVFNLPFIDKIVHMCMYYGLTIVLIYENRSVAKKTKNLFLLSIIPFVYGILIEFLQSWLTTTRQGEFFDALFDLIGILLAIISWRFFFYLSRKKN